MYHYFLELQNRVLYLLVFFFLIFTLNYYYKEALFYFLVKPVFFSASKELSYYFIYTNITEVFFTYFKISVLIAFYVLIPYTAIQV
jgi:sec-independent protein translocase protein TatC